MSLQVFAGTSMMLLDLALSPTSTSCTSSYKACCSTWPLHVVWDNPVKISRPSTFWIVNLSNSYFPFLDSTVQDLLALHLSLEPDGYRCLGLLTKPSLLLSTAVALFSLLPHLVAVTLNMLFLFETGCVPVPALRSSEQCFREGLC